MTRRCATQASAAKLAGSHAHGFVLAHLSERRRSMGSPTPNAIASRSQADGSARGGVGTLGECMASSTRRYLADLNGTPCREGLYSRMLREIELPLLREVLAWSGGNQSRAAEVLGIHRATLRKKLRELGIV